VGANYPVEWLARLEQAGLDVRSVKVLPEPQDTRTFYAYLSLEEREDTDPPAHFARVGRPTPRELVDYESSTTGQESRAEFMPLAVRPGDLSEAALGARGIHLAPADFLTHHTVPVAVRRTSQPVVTVDPSIRYMQPGFKDDVRRIVSGLDAFLPSEMEVRSYFRDERHELWEAAAALGAMGAKFIVIKLGARGQYLYESATGRKWHVPAYPATVRDVTGAGDAYCGGFLVGLTETGDPVEAALRGSISASLVIEGVGALYGLGSTPGLAEARLRSLREAVRRV
jgi:ribokinase